ncbi:MAG: hypothetical protein WD875_00515 [Pirellulales bacterium]
MLNDPENTSESKAPSSNPKRRWAFWASNVAVYAIALAVAIYFLHEDLPTTIIGIVIFTAGWVLSAYVDYRWRPKLPGV